jgi:hypothetical protein
MSLLKNLIITFYVRYFASLFTTSAMLDAHIRHKLLEMSIKSWFVYIKSRECVL